MKKKIAIFGISLLLIAGVAQAMGMFGWGFGRGYARGYGILPGYTQPHAMVGGMGGYGFGYGGMGGCMGFQPWNAYGYAGEQKTLTLQDAKEIAERYALPGTELAEIYEFENHFEAEFREKDTGYGAFEIIIDKFTGAVRPEMGPNMMWNAKYGMHTFYYTKPAITEEQAKNIAEQFLKQLGYNWKIDNEVEEYYGFYELHALADGELVAQINVNAYTGAVFIENWHGKLVNKLEVEEEAE